MGKDALHQQLVQGRIAELKAQISEGGLREAAVRAVLYIGMARDAVDERAFEAIRRIRLDQKLLNPLPIAEFKCAGARAVFHAADRYRRRDCSDPFDAAERFQHTRTSV